MILISENLCVPGYLNLCLFIPGHVLYCILQTDPAFIIFPLKKEVDQILPLVSTTFFLAIDLIVIVKVLLNTSYGFTHRFYLFLFW